MPKAKEPVGVIMRRPLETDKGKNFLFITRASNDAFQRTGTAIFAVDDVHTTSPYYSFDTEFGEISFHADTQFLVVPRELCRPVRIKELAKIQMDEKAEWDKAYASLPKDEEETVLPATEEYRPGNYA